MFSVPETNDKETSNDNRNKKYFLDDYPFCEYNIINGTIPKHCQKIVGFDFTDSKDNFVTPQNLQEIKNTSLKLFLDSICILIYNKKSKKFVIRKDLQKNDIIYCLNNLQLINNKLLFVIYKDNEIFHFNVENIFEFSSDGNCQLFWNEYKESKKWFLVAKKAIKRNESLTFTKIDDKYEKILQE